MGGLSGEEALGAAKAYTDQSLEGVGAIQGKNCTIQSVTPITGGNRVTFAWYNDGEDTPQTSPLDVMNGVDGSDGAPGQDGTDGEDGVSPEVTIDTITGGHRVTITDADHPSGQSFDVLDGTGADSIPHYTTMPSDADLFALPNNTVFETEGFWSQTDGSGGFYKITTSSTNGALAITYNNSTRYLLALDSHRGALTYFIDVARYGIRSVVASGTVPTEEASYAVENSNRIENINISAQMYRCILKFPAGRYYFKRSLNLINRQVSLVGEHMAVANGTMWMSGYRYGTILCFPYLTDGQTAVQITLGDVEDIVIQGNPNTYNFLITREQAVSDPQGAVVSETIGTSGGSEVKCTGLSTSGAGNIRNVTVQNFYTGVSTGVNRYITNLYTSKCHTGVKTGADAKFKGVYGFYCHTLVEVNGDLVSINQLRVDSCVNALHLIKCRGGSFVDIDGDWCTESLIYVTGETANSTFLGIGGRSCTMKNYNSSSADPPDVRDYANTSGYGVIRVDGGQFNGNNVIIKSLANSNVVDGSSDYKTPNILLTFSGTPNIINSKFDIANPSGITEGDDWLKLVQVHSGLKIRIDTAEDDCFIANGEVVSLKETITAIASYLG